MKESEVSKLFQECTHADSGGMAPIDGHRRVRPVLVLWAMLVVVTFGFAGAKIHYLLIDALFDSLSLRFSADDRPQMTPAEDGIVLNATMRYDEPSADKSLRPAVYVSQARVGNASLRPDAARE